MAGGALPLAILVWGKSGSIALTSTIERHRAGAGRAAYCESRKSAGSSSAPNL